MAKLISKGVTLKLGSTAIGQVISIAGPNQSVETADVTELGDGWRSYLGTISDAGEVSCTVHFDPDLSSQNDVYALLDSRAVSSFVLTFTDATPATFTFSGILTAFNVESMEVGGVITASLTIKVSSNITKA